jgi:hypothetical protein
MRSYTHLCWMSARGHKLASVQNSRLLRGFPEPAHSKRYEVAKVSFKKNPKTPPASQSRGGGFADRGRR